jgi:hypothetical protein
MINSSLSERDIPLALGIVGTSVCGRRRQRPALGRASTSKGSRSVGSLCAIGRHGAAPPEGSAEHRAEDGDVDGDDSSKRFAHAPAVDVYCAWRGLQRHHNADDSGSDNEDTWEEKQTQTEFPAAADIQTPKQRDWRDKDEDISEDVDRGSCVEDLRFELLSRVSISRHAIRVFDTYSALESRIRDDLPILLNRETTAGDGQEDRHVREHNSDSQPSDVGLHAQAGGQPTEEEQHAALQSPNEQSVAVPRQQF